MWQRIPVKLHEFWANTTTEDIEVIAIWQEVDPNLDNLQVRKSSFSIFSVILKLENSQNWRRLNYKLRCDKTTFIMFY